MDDENYSRPQYSHNISQSCWGDLDIHVPVGRVLDVDVQIRLDKTKTQLGLEMVEDPTKLFCCSPRFLGDDDLGTTIFLCILTEILGENTLKGELRLPGSVSTEI